MTIDEYISRVKERLLNDPNVSSFHIVRERATQIDGHLRVRVDLPRGSHLDFSEYVRRTPDGEIVVATYSYHWADANQRLIRRWDNAFHHPTLPNFPHHIHMDAEESVHAGEPVDIFFVLATIGKLIGE